jgi:septal ring-binding cell division protein DamX
VSFVPFGLLPLALSAAIAVSACQGQVESRAAATGRPPSASETEPPAPVAASSPSGSSAAVARPVQETSWRKLGEWSGREGIQTESFATDSGALRVRWKATVAPPAKADTASARAAEQRSASSARHFTLAIHSAISGRPLQVAVDRDTPGEGIAYVTDDPHTCFAKVDAEGFDWSFTVEEGVSGTVVR